MAHNKTGTPRKKTLKQRKKRSSSPHPVKNRDSSPQIHKMDAPPISSDHNRRSMERLSSDIGRLLAEQNIGSIDEANAFLSRYIGSSNIPKPGRELTPLELAQDKMYDAFDAVGDKRIELAREALAISPDCADAYVLLAEETTETVKEARDLYQKGVEAGERALGKEFFEENAGHFWGIVETRPYMRALMGLAEGTELLEEFKQAAEYYREALRLNPNDNQGVRYALARCLLREGADNEVAELLDKYKEDSTAAWLYTRSLWLYRKEGATKLAEESLIKALKVNTYVPLYMLGAAKASDEPIPYFERGGEKEAIDYVTRYGLGWLQTEGAIPWLLDIMVKVKDKLPIKQMRKRIMGE